MLLMVEAELPSGLPSAKELLHWGAQERRDAVYAGHGGMSVDLLRSI